jgi:hypothetical protein
MVLPLGIFSLASVSLSIKLGDVCCLLSCAQFAGYMGVLYAALKYPDAKDFDKATIPSMSANLLASFCLCVTHRHLTACGLVSALFQRLLHER